MRWLKAGVIGMGVLILIGLTIVIVTVVRRSAAPPPPAVASDMPSPPVIGAPPSMPPSMPVAPAAERPPAVRPFGETRIVLPPGAEAEETIAQGDRLIVRLRLPDGHGALMLIDARTGAKLGLIHLERQSPQ